MDVKRLKALRKRLVTLKEGPLLKFNMNVWFDPFINRDARIKVDKRGKCVVTEHVCGTAVCALGTAALMPEFQRQGLKITSANEAHWVKYKGSSGIEAGARFFDIESSEASRLFDPGCYGADERTGPYDDDDNDYNNGMRSISTYDVVVRIDEILENV